MENLSQPRTIRNQTGQTSRCAGGHQRKKKFSAPGFNSHAVLKHKFLPLYEAGKSTPTGATVESEFFESLAILVGFYDLEPLDVTNKEYPYNILLSVDHLEKQLRFKMPDISLGIVQTEARKVRLAIEQRYDLDNRLFYIPVVPLHRMLKVKKQKECAELLLSVFAYLFQVAHVPYYRDTDSYIYQEVEILAEWYFESEEDWEVIQRDSIRTEFKEWKRVGDLMFPEIQHPKNLEQLSNRIDKFTPKDTYQSRCLRLAKDALELYKVYPDYTVFRNFRAPDFDEDTDNDEEDMVGHCEQLVSFVAKTSGWVAEETCNSVNDVLNECSGMETPVRTAIYEPENQYDGTMLQFEYRLFPLIINLCDLLDKPQL